MGQFKTPLVSKLRKDSATFYTFGSAVEDIGLNINERNNIVRLSHYVVMNLPKMLLDEGEESGAIHVGNITEYADNFSSYPDNVLPCMIQNYVLNFETRLRNQGLYDFSEAQTVTEKAFWKWLQKTGALKLTVSETEDGKKYYHEDFANPEDAVIKGFGQVTTSSQASNYYNMNNETYITVPSSYGQMRYYLTENFDSNYVKGRTYESLYGDNLEGYDAPPTEEEFMGKAYSDEDNAYKLENDTDGLQMNFNIKDIRNFLKHEMNPSEEDLPYYDRATYDTIAIDSSMSIGTSYDFNTILVYYTIYDKSYNALSTNLFGMMVLDSTDSEEGSTEITIPSFKKTKTNQGSVGSEYSWRLNIQTASIYDTTGEIYDYSTAESATLSDFNGVISNLKTAVDILKNNSVVLSRVYTDNQGMKQLVTTAIDKVDELEKSVNDILHGNVREISANVLDSSSIRTKTFDASVSFVDIESDDIIYGKIDGSTFSYSNIDASTLNLKKLELETVGMGGDGLSVVNESGDTVLRIDTNGNIYTGSKTDGNNGCGRWIIAYEDVDAKGLYIKELDVKNSIEDIIKFIEEDENVKKFADSNLSYEEYLKKYWTRLVELGLSESLDTYTIPVSILGTPECNVVRFMPSYDEFSDKVFVKKLLKSELLFEEKYNGFLSVTGDTYIENYIILPEFGAESEESNKYKRRVNLSNEITYEERDAKFDELENIQLWRS